MKERPILFNEEMIRAILEGRKTQTRRIMRRQPDAVEYFKRGEPTTDTDAKNAILRCYNKPKGFKKCNSGWFANATYKTPFSEFNVGDHLWVRETTIISPPNWLAPDDVLGHPDITKDSNGKHRVIQYIASNPDTDVPLKDYKLKKTPSIHMPRWASRILLEITKIRVERIQDISESDCLKEGVGSPILRDCKKPKFMQLWESIYGADSWAANPWVWVVEFKVIQGGAA